MLPVWKPNAALNPLDWYQCTTDLIYVIILCVLIVSSDVGFLSWLSLTNVM